MDGRARLSLAVIARVAEIKKAESHCLGHCAQPVRKTGTEVWI